MPSSNTWTRQRTLLFMAVLFIIALLPRLVAVERYITPDELTWVYRSVLFREALLHGQWVDTLIAGHPGVTTTWLGALAISLQLAFQPAAQDTYTWITQIAWLAPDNAAAFQQLATFLTGGRVAAAVVNSLGLAALFPLLCRLYNRPVAVLATLLLALDPFVAGLSGLLHVDGLMTTFATLSLVSLGLVTPAGRWRMALFSGIMAGLAILSKSPAILLLPLAALYLFVQLWWPNRKTEPESLSSRFPQAIKNGAVWLLSCLLTLLVLLPALWAAPLNVFTQTGSDAGRHIEEALRPTFFLGQVTFEHGLWFYPLNLALRLSPVVFAGLIVAALMLIIQLVRLRRLPPLSTLLLAAWVILFLAGISLAAKKFDRYALPVIPSLIILSALGWWHLRSLVMRAPTGRQRSFNAGTILLLLLQTLYLLRYTPFPLSAYNLLLGGPSVAAQVVSVGWGEGISAGAQWLNTQNGTGDLVAVADSLPALAPFYTGRSIIFAADTVPAANNLLFSLNSKQIDPAGFTRLEDEFELLRTITYGGLDQAWVFRNPHPQPQTVPATWDSPLLYGQTVQLWAAQPSIGTEKLYLDVIWGVTQPTTEDIAAVITVHDPAGNEWSRLETPLLNEVYFPPEFWAPGERPHLRYPVDLPAAAPPGDYTMQIALFAGEAGARLPLRDSQGVFQGVTYTTNAVSWPSPANPVSPPEVVVPFPVESSWLAGELILLGTGAIPPQVTAGDRIPLDLFWHAPAGNLPDNVTVFFQLGNTPAVELPLSTQYPAGNWRAGETIQEKYLLPVPPTFPAGTYPLTVATCAAEMSDCPTQEIGQVEVAETDRNFTRPVQMDYPLNGTFLGVAGEALTLLGVDLPTGTLAAGEPFDLVLHWQAADRPAADYTVFVHLIDAQGKIVAQGDQWPGGLPATLRADGEVIRDEISIAIPAGTPDGEYTLIVGLYTAEDGVRRPVLDADGATGTNDSILLPFTLQITSN